MNRIALLDPNTATGRSKELLDAVKSKLGVLPNMMRAMANSPAALEAYMNLSGALAKGVLDAKTREAIALAVGQANRCQYCVSAHALLGKKAGLSDSDVSAARTGELPGKIGAIVRLALAINGKQGAVDDADLSAARAAGVSDTEMAETVAAVALNVYTNWFNHVANPQIDFPVVKL